LNRRRFLKYAGTGSIAAAIAGLGYYATTQTGIRHVNPLAPNADFDYQSSYINPTSADTICFLNKSRNPDSADIDLAYSWYVDDRMVANTKDYSTQLSSEAIATPHKVRLSACRAEQCGDVEKVVEVDPENLYPPSPMKTPIKGTCYDTGIQEDNGWSSNRGISKDEMQTEIIDIVNRELGCNGIRIMGDDNDNVIRAAEIAMQGSLDTILLSPRYCGASTNATIDKTVDLAKKAQPLYERSDKIALVIGNELTVETSDIYPGSNRQERSDQVAVMQHDKAAQEKLEELLRSLISSCEPHFGGEKAYAAGSWEWMMPWNKLDLDILGDNHYWYGGYGKWEDPDSAFFRHIAHYKKYGKPYFVTEYGLCPWEGSVDLGGNGWMHPADAKYDEDAQARGIGHYLDSFNEAGIDGSFYYTLILPTPDELDNFGLLKRKVATTKEFWETGRIESLYQRNLGFYMFKSYQRVS